MHCDVPQSVELAHAIDLGLQSTDAERGVQVVVAPAFVALTAVARELRLSSIEVAAQDMHWQESGAYTGEVSPLMLQGVCRHVILGHSERRHIFGETDEQVGWKVSAALAHGLNPIVCVGETLEEHDRGETEQVVARQLAAAFASAREDACLFSAVAYEPVWAIGTGRAATVEHASTTSALIRRLLAERFESGADDVRILYGGSVTPDNAATLLGDQEIDGALVGGASLKPESFLRIVGAVPAGRASV
jgi:triosephosphate isomerase